MTSVLASPFLHPTTHTYYFRRSVPKKLRPLIGLHEIKKSLKTKDWQVARPRFFFMQQQCEHLFMSLDKKTLTTREAKEAAQAFVKKLIQSWSPENEEHIYTYYLNIKEVLDPYTFETKKEITDLLGLLHKTTSDGYLCKAFTQDFIEAHGYSYPEHGSRAEEVLRETFEQESKKLFETALLRYNGDWKTNNDNYMPSSFISTDANSTKISPTTDVDTKVVITLKQALDAWIRDQFATKGEISTTLKTTDEYTMNVERFINHFGNIPVDAITKIMVTEFRDLLLKLPVNAKKDIKKLPFLEQIKIADENNLPRLSRSTVIKNLTAIGTIITFAQERLDAPITNDPIKTSGIIKALKKAQAKQDTEDTDSTFYSEDDLSLIFRGPAHQSNWQPPRCNFGKAFYWLPLICAYTGARREEIAQLWHDDIKQFDDTDRWYIDVKPGQGQKVKTPSSIRKIPLHRDLITLGLIEYAQSLPTNSRLFPELKEDPKQGYGYAIGDAWGEYLRGVIGITANIQPLHGFRHTFKTLSRKVGIHKEHHDKITGHSEGKNKGDEYGVMPLEVLFDAIDKFPSIAKLGGLLP